MFDQILVNLSKICKVLNDNNVKYLIIGGTSVAFYGYHRKSIQPNGVESDKFDIDIWYKPSLDNYVNLLKSLKILNFDFEEDYTKFEYYRKEYDNYILEFLPGLEQNYYNNKRIFSFNGADIHFISFDDLITIKKISNRRKDLIDIENLIKIKKD